MGDQKTTYVGVGVVGTKLRFRSNALAVLEQVACVNVGDTCGDVAMLTVATPELVTMVLKPFVPVIKTV